MIVLRPDPPEECEREDRAVCEDLWMMGLSADACADCIQHHGGERCESCLCAGCKLRASTIAQLN